MVSDREPSAAIRCKHDITVTLAVGGSSLVHTCSHLSPWPQGAVRMKRRGNSAHVLSLPCLQSAYAFGESLLPSPEFSSQFLHRAYLQRSKPIAVVSCKSQWAEKYVRPLAVTCLLYFSGCAGVYELMWRGDIIYNR